MKKMLALMVVAMMVLVGGISLLQEGIAIEDGSHALEDMTPPKVLSTAPSEGAQTGPSTEIYVNFSEPMNESSVEAAFSIFPPVNGTFSWKDNGTDMTFSPTSLENNTVYRITIYASIAKDLAGNLLDGNGNGYIDTPDSWTTGTDMPTSREAAAAVSVGKEIYVVGGSRSASDKLTTVEIYDTVNDTWTNGTPMSVGKSSLAAVYLNGTIYAIGGYDSNEYALTDVEAYDISNDTWVDKAPLPAPRRGLMAAVFHGKIYAFSGYDNDSNATNTTFIYDPSIDTWTNGTNMIYNEAYGFASVVNGKIYVIAGTKTQEYDPSTYTWTDRASRSQWRTGFSGAAVNGKLYAIGGSDDQLNAVSRNEEFNALENSSWTVKASMPTKRWDVAAAAVNGRIYVFGGGNSDGLSKKTEVYTPNDDYSWDFESTQNPQSPNCNISIHAGWNMVTLYWLSSDTDITDVLSGISWDRAMLYINGSWYTYNKNRDAKFNLGFPLINPKSGLMINATNDSILSGYSQDIGTTNISLHRGWNLVGYTSTQDKKVSDSMAGIPWTHIETADSGGNIYALSSDDYMISGKAYWIYVSEDCTWTVDW